LTPDPALLREIGYITAEPKHDCVFLGPAGAGKSSFLSALLRACQGNIQGGFSLSLFPGAALAELAGEAARHVAGSSTAIAPTEEPVSYDFQLEVGPPRNGDPLSLEVATRELPGREIFGPPDGDPPPLHRSPRARLWLQAARRASCLILCVDSMETDRLRWEILLPQLVESFAVSSGRLIDRLSRPGQNDLPPVLSPKRQLPYTRILVLLTKIDKSCAAAASAILSQGSPAPGPISPVLADLARRPRDLAARLDPIRLVEDRFGTALLGQLRAAAAPGTRLAVGLASAWGFGGSEATRTRGASALERWSPFGIREALLFIATGEARHPVAVLDPAPRAEPPDVSAGNVREKPLQFGGRR